jgi:hypothetical protein
MTREFFRMWFDQVRGDFWFVDQPRAASGAQISAFKFTSGLPVETTEPLDIRVDINGRRTVIAFGALDIVIARTDVLDTIEQLPNILIQRIPVTIDGRTSDYEILNILDVVDCLDHQHLNAGRYSPEEIAKHPPRAKQYKHIYGNEIIDPKKAEGHHLFRPEGWLLPVIVSDVVKDVVISIEPEGIAFLPANTRYIDLEAE